jgi:hypothetical protein
MNWCSARGNQPKKDGGLNSLLVKLLDMAIMREFQSSIETFRPRGYNQLIKEIEMNKLIILACLGFAVSAPVFAGAQQDKMKGCNQEAKADALKGDARKDFMSKCLKKDYVLKSASAAEVKAAAPVKQQDKMKNCNADAATKALKGEERKAFMKICLKG